MSALGRMVPVGLLGDGRNTILACRTAEQRAAQELTPTDLMLPHRLLHSVNVHGEVSPARHVHCLGARDRGQEPVGVRSGTLTRVAILVHAKALAN